METYHGHVRTPQDAIILFEACRLGLLPRVQRRLSEKERQSIRSGSVFVWDEREAGMRRWTDGKSWSASRVAGSFLNYREMEGKRGGSQQYNSPVPSSGAKHAGHSPPDADMEGDGPTDGYRYKPDGLVKQSFSITTTQGQHLHLISYYSRSDPHAAMLPQPSNDIHLRDIHPQKGMYPDASVPEGQGMPAVTRSPMIGSFHNSSPGTTPNGFPPHQRHHPQFSSGYGWPPSPMNTPPAGHYPHFAGHTPNGYGHSPGYFPGQQQQQQQQQQPQPQPSQQPQQHSHHQHHGPPPPSHHQQPQQQHVYGRPPPPGPTAFDRAPPPLSHSLPPPTTQPPHSYGPSHGPGSQYPPHPFQRAGPPPSQGGGPPPPYPYHHSSDRQATTPPYSHGRPVEQPPPQSSTYSPLPSAPQPAASAQKSASTIPSIGSLINKSPPAMHAPPPYAGTAPPSQPPLPHGRRSPPSTTAGAEKAGFSDPGIKALRQLDRHFT